MSERTPHRILVVDDDPETVEIMRRLLTARGFTVETATDPREAMGRMESETYAVVLSDILMPGMSGHEVTEAVLAGATGTQVILMTAFSSIAKVSEAYRLGASDYLLKPFDDLGEVGDAVNRGVERYERWAQALGDSDVSEKGEVA
jgi:two-component system NtrC family response regulator